MDEEGIREYIKSLEDEIIRQNKEIERLNQYINELEYDLDYEDEY
jgi:peptidoglycan hydrolase CwlO-like protein